MAAPDRRRRMQSTVARREVRHGRHGAGAAMRRSRRARAASHIAIDVRDRRRPSSAVRHDPLRSSLVGDRHRGCARRGVLLPASRIAAGDRAGRSRTRSRRARRLRPRAERRPRRRRPPSRRASPRARCAGESLGIRIFRALDERRDGAAPRAARGSGGERRSRRTRSSTLLVLAARRRHAARHSTSTRCSRATCSIRADARTGSICSRSSSSTTRMTIVEELCGKGKDDIPFDEVPDRLRARLLVRGRGHDAGSCASASSRSSSSSSSRDCFAKSRCRSSRCSPTWSGRACRSTSTGFASLKDAVRARARAGRAGDLRGRRRGVQHQLQPPAARDPVREAQAAGSQEDADGPIDRRERLQELAEEGHQLPVLLMEYRELVEAREHVPRCASGARASRRRGACTRRSTRPSRRPDDCRRAIRISRTFRFAASSGATFVAASFRGRAGSSSRPTIRRSSCDCSRTCRAIRRSSRRSSRAATFIARRRRSSSTCRSTQVTRTCARAPRRSTSRRSTARARTRCRGSSRSARRGEGVHRDATSSASEACARISTR